MKKVTNGEVGCYLYFYVRLGNRLVALSFFDRTKSAVQALGSYIKVKAKNGGQIVCKEPGAYRGTYLNIPYNSAYEMYMSTFMFNRDRANICFVYDKSVGEDLLLTTNEWAEKDLYNAIMKKFTLPIMEEWMPYIMERMKYNGVLQIGGDVEYSDETATIPFHRDGKECSVLVKDLKVLYITASEEYMESIVSKGIKDGVIGFTDKPQYPLNLGKKKDGTNFDLDTYMENYGKHLNANVENVIHPLVPLKSTVEGFAARNKRIYPQQAAVINGIIALADKGEKYGFATCDMGTGKTMMAIGMVEGKVNQKWLKEHPGKTLKDMYLSPESEQPKYRAIVMPPSHLTQKWKREIETEVTGAKVTILESLSQLVELRASGKEPKGREWYVISKDFCKLDGYRSPIPTIVGKGYIEQTYCRTCYTAKTEGYVSEDSRKVPVMMKYGRGTCEKCGEKRNFFTLPKEDLGLHVGMICPHCGKLLLSNKSNLEKVETDMSSTAVLGPKDFAEKTTDNAFCRHCGTPLWGYECKPVGAVRHKSPWHKVSYYKNWNKKGRDTSWVLNHHEMELYLAKGMLNESGKVDPDKDVQEAPIISTRKVAPSTFMKKYLKGYFDFSLLDELHKYEGSGTAQMQAAHALIKCSKFVIGLTGTLTNGMADSLYYLFWMLEPRRMKEAGYRFENSFDFSKKYGCVETRYEYNGHEDRYGKLSKGRVLSRGRVKAGINPVVYSEFLLGNSISMSLSDMTKYMPELHEHVEVIPLPDDVKNAYGTVSNILSEAVKKTEGACLMGETLTFCLSYPDKPYGRSNIMHPRFKNELVLSPPSCDIYKDALLPKEERICEIIRQEMEENRNVFVFANFTGKDESNVTERLKSIIEAECNLAGRVMVLRSDTPEAKKREAFIHNKAKDGIKVVITNAKVVETGLDFCWEDGGVIYNYPTIIFAQPTYELSVMMQSSKRHYRLNQKEECRTYWMAYEDTLQAAALQIMASKQVAASAIQGKFSASGLASMASGVDPRVMLAAKLSSGDNSSKEELSSMFDVLAKSNLKDEESELDEQELQPLYFEIMGIDYKEDEIEEIEMEMPSLFEDFETVTVDTTTEVVEVTTTEKGSDDETEVIDFEPSMRTSETAKAGKKKKKSKYGDMEGLFEGETAKSFGDFTVFTSSIITPFEVKASGKKKKVDYTGCISLFA